MKTLKTILSKAMRREVEIVKEWAKDLRNDEQTIEVLFWYAANAFVYMLSRILWLAAIIAVLLVVYVFAVVEPYIAMVLYPIIFVPLIVTIFVMCSDKDEDKGKKKKASKRSRNR